VFVYYYSHVARPFHEVEGKLLALQEAVLTAAAERAYQAGEAVRAEVNVGGGFKLSKKVLVMLHPAKHTAAGTLIPVSVEASGPSSLFPRLEGEIEAAPLGAELTQVGLRGTYRAPLGFVGTAIDRLLLHRVAEAAIKNLVDQLCQLLEADQPVDRRLVKAGSHQIAEVPSDPGS
jgi:hypothetical protein